MGLGSLRAVPLSVAREKAAECRALIADKIDPIEARERAWRLGLDTANQTISFEEAANRFIDAHKASWKNEKHASQWRNTLETYAFPVAGKVAVSEISTQIVLQIIEPIWSSKTETANRVRGRIERILNWATVIGYRSGENPARWRGHLESLLPAKGRVRRVQHHSAMPYEKVRSFILFLRSLDAMSARALEFLIYTAARSSEVLGAQWSEVQLSDAVWIIPAERTKTSTEHRIPLSDPAMNILRSLRENAINSFLFPGDDLSRGLSNMAMLQLMRRSKYDFTVHGFRSSFRDWAAEQTNATREVAEQALAHAIGNKVEAAYRRSDLFEKRRRLMDQWARYLNSPD
jgi:integrase